MDIDYSETKIDFSALPDECKKNLTDDQITEILEQFDIKELSKFPMITKYIQHRTHELEERMRKDKEALEKYNYTMQQINASPEQRKQNARDRLKKKLELKNAEK